MATHRALVVDVYLGAAAPQEQAILGMGWGKDTDTQTWARSQRNTYRDKGPETDTEAQRHSNTDRGRDRDNDIQIHTSVYVYGCE